MTHEEITGRTLEFHYTDETYRIDVLSETRVRWTRTIGDPQGASDEEDYIYSQISRTQGLITWIEADGLGLSNILDFEALTVTTHANMGRAVFRNPGRLVVA